MIGSLILILKGNAVKFLLDINMQLKFTIEPDYNYIMIFLGGALSMVLHEWKNGICKLASCNTGE